jgi:hypothetical protein
LGFVSFQRGPELPQGKSSSVCRADERLEVDQSHAAIQILESRVADTSVSTDAYAESNRRRKESILLLVKPTCRAKEVAAPRRLLLFDLSPAEQSYIANRVPVIERQIEAACYSIGSDRRPGDVGVTEREDLAVYVTASA